MINSSQLDDMALQKVAASCRDEAARYDLGRGVWQVYERDDARSAAGS